METDIKKDTEVNAISPEENNQFTSINEGSAEIVVEGRVFYNPVQQFNRDLSLSVLTTFSKIYQTERMQKCRKKNSDENSNNTDKEELEIGKVHKDGLVILEALSATGLRSIRYAKEVVGIKRIVANDLSRKAVDSIEANIKRNNVEHLVEASYSDAMTLMYLSTSPDKRFTVIDLDPYGSPTRFLDGAVQSIADGGLLLVTATDMAVLAGGTPEACYVKYGSVPLKTKSCHEMALRILLRTIDTTANRYGRYIRPLLSISADFYIRVFVRVFESPSMCKRSSSKQSMVFQCTGCDTLTFQPIGLIKPNPTESNPNQVKYGIPTGPFVNGNCEHCNHRHHMGGPIWTDPIHDIEFVNELLYTICNEPYSNLATNSRIMGILSVIKEELPNVPLYYGLDKICSILKLEVVPILKFRSALLNANYNVSFSHACKTSIKTDAPASVLWDILRCWAKTHPVKAERYLDGTPLKAILSKEPTEIYDLETIHPMANPESRRNALVRFPENPTAHWGPGTRATLMVGDNKMAKSIKNQDKNKNRGKRRYTKDEYLAKKKQKPIILDGKN